MVAASATKAPKMAALARWRTRAEGSEAIVVLLRRLLLLAKPAVPGVRRARRRATRERRPRAVRAMQQV